VRRFDAVAHWWKQGSARGDGGVYRSGWDYWLRYNWIGYGDIGVKRPSESTQGRLAVMGAMVFGYGAKLGLVRGLVSE
jgi:hypothetical protein